MDHPLICSIDHFAAEPHDACEWRISGRAWLESERIVYARIEFAGELVAPLTYGWPRNNDLSSTLPRDGFTGYFFFPMTVPAGTHTLELVFCAASGLELGREKLAMHLSEPIAPRAAAAEVHIDAQHPQAAYVNLLTKTLLALPYTSDSDVVFRLDGRDWPDFAHSMAGLARLNHLRACVETVIREGVPGDLIETGVWRGGACILMRGVLAAFGERERRVWVADSFEGLPPPNPGKYPADLGDTLFEFKQLAVSLEQVQENFRKYGLLDEQVHFVKGFFSQSLPKAPVQRLALLRLDGDMYESTMDALEALYPKLSPGGFCVVDDYGAIAACRQAVHDYRRAHGIDAPIGMIDWTGAWWRRE